MGVAVHKRLLCKEGPQSVPSQEDGDRIGGVPEEENSPPDLVQLRAKPANLSNNAQVTGRDPQHGYTAPDRFDQIVWRAMASGARKTSPITWEWDASGGCEAPVYRLLKSRRTDLHGKVEAVEGQYPQRYLDMHVPCRRCPRCLRRKAAHWRLRAIEELRIADENGWRSWRVTLTLNPHARAIAIMRARGKVTREEWNSFSQEERTAKLANAFQPEITKYLKRVRAESGSALRYLSVTEPHKDGIPHWHLLVHEAGDIPVRHVTLSRQWAHGYSNCKLVDSAGLAAAYPAKYITKTPNSRVRASVGYGQGA